jgi:hypothetical protein
MPETICLDPVGPADPRDPHRRYRRSPPRAGTGWSTTAAPTRFGHRHERGPERYYVGRRASLRRVYIVDRAGVEPLTHLRCRTEAEFDWGESGDGALELAFALLSHAAIGNPPEPVCRVFCDEVIVGLPADGFVLAYGQVALWLLMAASSARRDWLRNAPTLTQRLVGWVRHGLRGA